MSAQPSVCSAMKSASMSPFSTRRCRSPFSRARSVPGLICRNRSARCAVSVRRGSTTISLAPAFIRSAILQEQDRVAVGRVGADHEKQVRAVEVGIGAGRSVGAERLLESGACTGHAQPGVRLDVNGAQETLGQFGGEILRLDGHLAGHVQRDGVGSVFVNDGAQSPARLGDGVVDRRRHRLVITRWPHQCRFQPPVVGGHHLRVGRALRAQPAEVGRVQLVSGYLRDDAAYPCRW